ncbi:MAG TPA: lipoyl synthase [Gammaproteobacteria bacterium]|nr:lipoyl synthase [Gammaproteobacteria bacterium]
MSKIIPVFDFSDQPNAARMPAWIRQRLGGGQTWQDTQRAVHDNTLHTVCEEAACPNRGECWSRGTATFMLLGDTCTRACGFCNVKTGRPEWFDEDEPRRVAEAVMALGLDYVVLTSVNRDDLPDGGAAIFARTLIELRRRKPDIGVEFLTPDFKHTQDNAVAVIMAALDEVRSCPTDTQLVWGHNVETVPSLYREVRKGASYENSLALLEMAARQPGVEAKSAIMLGLGESEAEVNRVLQDLRARGVQRVSLGQYLRPTRYHVPVRRYLEPEEFDDYARTARAMGFAWVKAGPLVRSSYHAEEEQES